MDKETEALAILDEAALREITEAAGMRPVDLIDMFVDDAAQNLAAMQTAWTTQDRESLHRGAHTLKSSAASAGALRVAHLARALDAQSKAGLSPTCATLLAQLAVALAQFQTHVASQRAQLS